MKGSPPRNFLCRETGYPCRDPMCTRSHCREAARAQGEHDLFEATKDQRRRDDILHRIVAPLTWKSRERGNSN